MKIKLLTLLALLLATLSQAKTWPTGAGIVCPVRDSNLGHEHWIDSSGIHHLIWTDPEIQFVLVRDDWATLEPSDGTYDWSYLDLGLFLAQHYGKPIVISVSGAVYPPWIQSEGTGIWKSSLNGDSCPFPWDSNLQAKFGTLVTAMGVRYEGYGIVRAVTMWCGGTGIECFFARNTADDNTLDGYAGGGTGSGATFWENAAKSLIDYYINAFPTTRLYLACGQNYFGDSKASMSDLANWVLSQPKAIGLQSNALTSTYPFFDNSVGYWTFPHTTLDCNSSPHVMYQYLDPIVNPNMGGATNTQVMQNAHGANAQAVQCYPADPDQDDEAGVIYFNDLFGL